MYWQLKHQDVVALSTTESEYMALAKGAQQAKWVHNFLSEVRHAGPLPSILKADNKDAIAILENPKFHSHVKHIDIHFHYLWDAVKSGELTVDYIPLEDNPANILTKPLGTMLHC